MDLRTRDRRTHSAFAFSLEVPSSCVRPESRKLPVRNLSFKQIDADFRPFPSSPRRNSELRSACLEPCLAQCSIASENVTKSCPAKRANVVRSCRIKKSATNPRTTAGTRQRQRNRCHEVLHKSPHAMLSVPIAPLTVGAQQPPGILRQTIFQVEAFFQVKAFERHGNLFNKS